MRTIHWYGAAAFVVVASLLAGSSEAAQRFKWWQSDDVKAEIDLTEDQSDELEEIFQAIRPKQRELMQRLEAEEEELTSIMHALEADEWEIALQIDKVETARSALSKTRLLMLYRMHRVLTPAQLDALHDMWERRRGRRSRSRC